MLLQPEKLDFILANIKEFEAHESINHWTLIKNSEVNNHHKINMGSSILFYPFGISSTRDSQIED